jgi:hypothetical protein
VVEQTLANAELLAGARRHQHDIDKPLVDHLANLVAILGQRLHPAADSINTRRADAKGHVGVFGIGEDKRATAVGVRMNGRQFPIQRFRHGR